MFQNKTEGPLRILIIDDDPDDCLLTTLNLKENLEGPLDIHHADGYTDAMKKIASGNYHLTLVDGFLHNWGTKHFKGFGGNMIPYITLHSPLTRVIAISAQKHNNDLMREMGAHSSVEKEVLQTEKIGNLFMYQ